jgi:hypothetical protein
MNCEQAIEILYDAISNNEQVATVDREFEQAASHTAQCSSCRHQLAQLQKVLEPGSAMSILLDGFREEIDPCEAFQENVAAYALPRTRSALSREEMAAVENHLRTCPACTAMAHAVETEFGEPDPIWESPEEKVHLLPGVIQLVLDRARFVRLSAPQGVRKEFIPVLGVLGPKDSTDLVCPLPEEWQVISNTESGMKLEFCVDPDPQKRPGTVEMTVKVSSIEGDVPLRDAYVCLLNKDDLLFAARTVDSNGKASFVTDNETFTISVQNTQGRVAKIPVQLSQADSSQ